MPKTNDLPVLEYSDDTYWTSGHIDPAALRDLIIAEGMLKEVDLSKVSHEYWRIGRDTEEGQYVYRVAEKGRGAKAVTVYRP